MAPNIVEPPRSVLRRAAGHIVPTVRYWLTTEVHVYAFSIAANIVLSFFPFLIVMLSLCYYVLHWEAATNAIFLALKDYFPDELGAFIQRNLWSTVQSRGKTPQIASLVLLLFTANGVFEPMEVALNRCWGITTNRSYWRNQLVSLGLIFICGGLAMLSMMLTALNTEFLHKTMGTAPAYASALFLKIAAVPLIILILFLIYWILPNAKISAARVLPIAIVVGLLLEGLKYINLLTWNWLQAKLASEYGPFKYSAALILWGFCASMIILAGAEWSARGNTCESPPTVKDDKITPSASVPRVIPL